MRPALITAAVALGLLALVEVALRTTDVVPEPVTWGSPYTQARAEALIELGDVEVESLVPPALRDCSVEEFLERLPESDESMRSMLASAQEADEVLRYVGTLTADGQARVGIRRLGVDHAFAHLALTDNIVRFVTARYSDNPLIVQGPGAGPAVTAGGVFGDLLRLAAYLGARI